jgi:hypothetical protein
MQIKLGQKVKDTITGFDGTATGRCEYLTGVPRVQVVRQNTDGKMQEEWLDEPRLEVVSADAAKPAETPAP